MNLAEVTKKQFLKRLKNPDQAAVLESINLIRAGLRAMYMEMYERPKLQKNDAGFSKLLFVVSLPGIRDAAEFAMYSNYVEDLVHRSFKGRYEATIDQIEYLEEDHKFAVRAFLLKK